MTLFEERLASFFFAHALKRSCPDLVPRSGAAGAKVNCFTVYVDKDKEPYLLVRGITGDVLTCHEWTGSRFEKPVDVALKAVDSKDVSITHFYGYSEVQYRGVIAFAVGLLFFLPYVKIHAVRALDATDQYFFNKKKLVTKQRIDLLRQQTRQFLQASVTTLGSVAQSLQDGLDQPQCSLPKW